MPGMAKPNWKRACLYGADFHVADDGSIKLIKPTDRRLTRGVKNGHPWVKVAGEIYFVADLVARAHLDSKTGLIYFIDGDRGNVRSENLLIVDSDPDGFGAMTRRPREGVPRGRDRDHLWWREDIRTGKDRPK
jgi:hypothetical protein